MILAVVMIVTITNINITSQLGMSHPYRPSWEVPLARSHTVCFLALHTARTLLLSPQHHAKESGARTWQWLQDKTRARGGFRHLNSEMIHVNGFIHKLGYTANGLMNHHIHQPGTWFPFVLSPTFRITSSFWNRFAINKGSSIPYPVFTPPCRIFQQKIRVLPHFAVTTCNLSAVDIGGKVVGDEPSHPSTAFVLMEQVTWICLKGRYTSRWWLLVIPKHNHLMDGVLMKGNFPHGVFTNEEHRESCSANPGDTGHPFTFNQSQVRKSCQEDVIWNQVSCHILSMVCPWGNCFSISSNPVRIRDQLKTQSCHWRFIHFSLITVETGGKDAPV